MPFAVKVALLAMIVAGVICFFFAFHVPAHAGEVRCGTASWYGAESGGIMANGRRFNPNAMTAAMWGVPLGSRVRVTMGGRSVVVTITDRGPAKRLHRLIDLSRGAARALGMGGLARVCLSR